MRARCRQTMVRRVRRLVPDPGPAVGSGHRWARGTTNRWGGARFVALFADAHAPNDSVEAHRACRLKCPPPPGGRCPRSGRRGPRSRVVPDSTPCSLTLTLRTTRSRLTELVGSNVLPLPGGGAREAGGGGPKAEAASRQNTRASAADDESKGWCQIRRFVRWRSRSELRTTRSSLTELVGSNVLPLPGGGAREAGGGGPKAEATSRQNARASAGDDSLRPVRPRGPPVPARCRQTTHRKVQSLVPGPAAPNDPVEAHRARGRNSPPPPGGRCPRSGRRGPQKHSATPNQSPLKSPHRKTPPPPPCSRCRRAHPPPGPHPHRGPHPQPPAPCCPHTDCCCRPGP